MEKGDSSPVVTGQAKRLGDGTENPYASPVSDLTDPSALVRRDFVDIDTRRLKQIRSDSNLIRTIAVLLLLGVTLLVAWGVVEYSAGFLLLEDSVVGAFFGLPAVITAIGLIRRERWGRIIGFIYACLTLIVIPAGTIVGILWIMALRRSSMLFGPDRLIHREIEAEWKYRKLNKVP